MSFVRVSVAVLTDKKTTRSHLNLIVARFVIGRAPADQRGRERKRGAEQPVGYNTQFDDRLLRSFSLLAIPGGDEDWVVESSGFILAESMSV